MADIWCVGGGCGNGGGGVFGFCQALFDFAKGLLFAFADAFKFLGYTCLDLEFEGFGAGGVRLYVGSIG